MVTGAGLPLGASLCLALHLLCVARGCILLLNGWSPLSVQERTALAQVVLTARVLAAYKDQRTAAETYTARVKVLQVYKGADVLRTLPEDPEGPRVFNVSNFGDTTLCYADVEDGQSYILFLTTFEDRLSAKYDDIFGAAAELSLANEMDILELLGWRPWTEWGVCSATCGGGRQLRRRECARANSSQCAGTRAETRQCNFFRCDGAFNLLPLFGFPRLPVGVTRDANRTSAYSVGERAHLVLPVSSLFQLGFPRTFSLLATVRVHFQGYVLTLSDVMGRQLLGLGFGSALRFEHLDSSDRVVSHAFTAHTDDAVWHSVGVQVETNSVTLYLDCDDVYTDSLQRSVRLPLGNNLMLAVGPYYPQYGQAFQGDIEQLILSENPLSVEGQCSLEHQEATVEDEASQPILVSSASPRPSITTSTTTTSTTSKPCLPPCQNGGVCLPSARCQCPRGYRGKACHVPECTRGCYNGGTCVRPDTCVCAPSYTGPLCKQAVCEPACQNGGVCVAPNKCSCPHGFLPPACHPHCSMECQNGGTCVSFNHCKCAKGYKGSHCSIPQCRKGCFNGARCVAPNVCACPRGFRGKRCERARCRPGCKNGGHCVTPNVCLCRRSFTGPRCQQFQCFKRCRNGGTCVGPNRCTCPEGFFGRRCQRHKCRVKCLNGGQCKSRRRCRCPEGFFGRRCEKRACRYEKYSVPYQRTFRRVVRVELTTRCGAWGWKTCRKTRVKYVLISRESYRSAYRCV